MTSDLNHDIGKYIARTAINIRDSDGLLPSALLKMLLRDLYELDGSQRASKCFERALAELPPTVVRPSDLHRIREHLATIDELEGRVRKGDPDAVLEVRDRALAIHEALKP